MRIILAMIVLSISCSAQILNPSGTASLPFIDLRTTSVDCSGSVDSSTAFTSLFSAEKGYTLAASTTNCNLKLASSVEPASTGAWLLQGSAGSGGFGAGNLITCSMSGTPCLWFDRQRDVDFGRLNINVSSASAGLQISQMGNTSGQISTNNRWHDMYFTNVGSGESAILVAPSGDSGSNEELQRFTSIGMFSSGSGIGTGFNVANPLPNCRSMSLLDLTTNNFATGYAFGCASTYMIGGLQEANNLDFSGNSSNQALGGGLIEATHSESSKQWIANFGSTGPFGFLFNRNEMNTPDLTKFQWDLSLASGNFITMGNKWGANANVTKMVQLSTVGGSWITIGDQFPNTTQANLPDLSHANGSVVDLITPTRYGSVAVISNGNNGNTGADNEVSGLYLLANDTSDGGSLQSFYAPPGLDIVAVFNPASGPRQFLPWRFTVTGSAPTGSNPPATFVLKIDKDPMTGNLPLTTGALGMDFTGGVLNGGILKLPASSAVSYATNTRCAAVGTAASPSVVACSAAPAGSFSCATNASGATCVVDTTAVTANSEIFIQEDASLGTLLGVTCNTTNITPTNAPIASRVAGTSFTLNLGTVATNPECFSYHLVN